MPEFKSPIFAKLGKKIERAQDELEHLSRHLVRRRPAIMHGDWEATSAAASGVHNVYNGIEDILLTVARDVDGSVPEGPSASQDILDQMVVAIPGVRGAVVSEELHRDLSDLKGFRHLVRHRYGIELSGPKVVENMERVQRAFPMFVSALATLESTLLADPDIDGGAARPGRR